ncbi:hypothetical protein L484_004399 [Morus notabilis]|uniref:Kunitz-type serine protease inhibitor n=1 Tax=Morus notabilis TaxID=981085 RepID=W9S4L2_9ROSA|nr:uncharacterized protein LOC21387901 [Morus notabilis]AUR26488.1 kunitz-type serine protease inhibitor [Morus notabilis]EXC10221.1 hypothetical protein L484_004399 [Morus notabilis]
MEAISLVTVFLLFLSFTTRGDSARPGLGVLPPAVVDSSGNELLKGKYYDLVAWPNVPLPLIYVSSISPLVEEMEPVGFNTKSNYLRSRHRVFRPGWFKFERNSEHPRRDYKLLWCPVYVVDQYVRSSDDCQTIGIFADSDGIERLTLADTSVPFGFRAYVGPQSDQHLKMSTSNA